MGVCYIIGAGDFFGSLSVNEGDLVVAADGGYDALCRLGITPDILVGDFDSLANIPSGIKTVRHPIEKDETDMYLAYRIGAEAGYEDFVIYGGVGGREDHTFANYCLLLDAKNKGNNVKLIGNGTEITVAKNEKITLFGELGATFSVFAFGGDAEGVSIKGAKYEAENITLTSAFPLGVSNSFTDRCEVNISVACGALLIFKYLKP